MLMPLAIVLDRLVRMYRFGRINSDKTDFFTDTLNLDYYCIPIHNPGAQMKILGIIVTFVYS